MEHRHRRSSPAQSGVLRALTPPPANPKGSAPGKNISRGARAHSAFPAANGLCSRDLWRATPSIDINLRWGSGYAGRRQAGAYCQSPIFEWRVTRPEPSIGAENVGKRWATRENLSPRAPCREHVADYWMGVIEDQLHASGLLGESSLMPLSHYLFETTKIETALRRGPSPGRLDWDLLQLPTPFQAECCEAKAHQGQGHWLGNSLRVAELQLFSERCPGKSGECERIKRLNEAVGRGAGGAGDRAQDPGVVICRKRIDCSQSDRGFHQRVSEDATVVSTARPTRNVPRYIRSGRLKDGRRLHHGHCADSRGAAARRRREANARKGQEIGVENHDAHDVIVVVERDRAFTGTERV